MRHPPQAAKSTEVLEWDRGRTRRFLDDLASEEPLEIRVNGVPVTVTMRTPGDDFDLAAGFLWTEGMVSRREQIARIAYGFEADGQRSGNRVDVTLSAEATFDPARFDRHFVSSSSCGICGKASIDAVRARELDRPNSAFSVSPELLTRLPEVLHAGQHVFGRTGGLHAAALFDANGGLGLIREDIGRHNAVDKVVGRALVDGHVPLGDRVLLVSGRGGFEIVQKALVAGVPVVASVSAPSSLAVQLAREYGLTLVGFLRGRRFIVYAGEQRVTASPPTILASPRTPDSDTGCPSDAEPH
jgi:FdhD protein